MSDELECKLPLPTKEVFDKASIEVKLGFLYDLQCTALENQSKVVQHLRKRQKKDTAAASAMGLVGGFAAVIVSKLVKLWE